MERIEDSQTAVAHKCLILWIINFMFQWLYTLGWGLLRRLKNRTKSLFVEFLTLDNFEFMSEQSTLELLSHFEFEFYFKCPIHFKSA